MTFQHSHCRASYSMLPQPVLFCAREEKHAAIIRRDKGAPARAVAYAHGRDQAKRLEELFVRAPYLFYAGMD